MQELIGWRNDLIKIYKVQTYTLEVTLQITVNPALFVIVLFTDLQIHGIIYYSDAT